MQTRILLLLTDLRIGGTPAVVRELAVRLQNDPAFSVHVACLDGWGPVANQLREKGVAVTALDARGRLDLRVVPRLIHLIHREKIDTVFSFLIHANAVAALASQFVSGVRFLQSIQTTQPYPRWHWLLQNAIQDAAERIVVPSQSAADAAEHRANVEHQKILVIPNAVDIASFTPVAREIDRNRIGFIGRLDPIKRVEDLVRAMTFLPVDFRLEIFGEGPQRSQIESLIAHYGLEERVMLRGEIAGSEGALRTIDVLVLPSDAEGFGLVLIEAMAAGVPVIGTNVPGIREVIEDNVSGLLAPQRDPGALARLIQRVLSDPILWQKLSDGGRDRVRRNYDWRVWIEAYRNLLRRPN